MNIPDEPEEEQFIPLRFKRIDTMVNLLRWTTDKVDMYQMFKIFVDLKIPFKVDTRIYPITDIAKRYLRAKRAKN